jgi:hypothetical protein
MKTNITNVADLLKEFVLVETEILNQQNIKHPPTIGTMYEGLTEDVLKKALFTGFNLQIVRNSFIIGCDTEFDVMLIEGEGEQIPYTNRYKCKPEDVIAIIEVKKNLYSKDVREGFSNLQFLVDYFEAEPEPFVGRLFRDGFRAICRKDVTSKKAGTLTEDEDLIFSTLGIEAFLPVRMIWGYNGFASEFSFRKSFVNYLKDNLTTDFGNKIGGFGPHNFPNLIICGNYTMIKQNGMPFGSPREENGWWPFYTSSSFNPTYYFLELIWTRLSYKFDLPTTIFGKDLNTEPVNRFLDCRLKKMGDHAGWEYNFLMAKDASLKEPIISAEWSPVELDMKQHVIISELTEKGEIDIKSDGELETFILEGGSYQSLSDFLEKLQSTGLVFIEKNKIKLLTDECQCVITPDGKMYAAENKSGRLTNWVEKKISDLKYNVDK